MKAPVYILCLILPIAAAASDLADMNRARKLYGSGKLAEAIAIYDKIPKSSNYWLEAMEEKAHAYGRQKNYAKALATLQSVTGPVFEGLIGPEPYFATALTHLKTCDYSAVLETTKKYKEAFKSRRAALQSLANGETTAAMAEAQSRIGSGKLSLDTLGPMLKELPRQIVTDKKAARSASLFGARVKQMAQFEVKEIDSVTNRMHVLEAEVIHRVHLADKKAGERRMQGKIQSGNDVLRFPVDDEVWIDELDNYQAELEECPATNLAKNRRAGL